MRNRHTLALALAAATFESVGVAPGGAAPRVAQAAPSPLPTVSALPARPAPSGLILPAVPAVEPGYRAPATPLPAGDIVGVAQSPFVGIGLQDAIAMALAKNNDLAVSQSSRRIAGYQIVAAQGAYDVRFQLVPQYEHSVSPAVNAFATGPNAGPITQDTFGVTTGFQGLTENGGRYSATVNGTRVTSNNITNSYDPFYNTSFNLNITQPLLRGRGIDDARRAVALAQAGAGIQSSVALVQASNTVVQVEDTYWDLVAAWRNVAIQEEGLRQSQAQAASNSRLARQGAVAPTDIVEANTQVNVFQDNVFSALQNVQRLQSQLKTLILANPADPVWMANLVPTSAVAQVPAEPSLDALMNSAIANRPEIAQLRAQRRQADVNSRYARDQLKPQLDLGLGYTSNGFAGVPTDPAQNPITGIIGGEIGAINALIARSNAQNPGQPPIPAVNGSFGNPPGYQTGRLGQSFTDLLDNRFPTYAAQLTLSVPLGNRTAKADAAIADEQQRQVALQETALVQRIRSESTNAIQGLRAAQYRLISARAAREAAERVLLGEQRRFQAGTSTTFLVLQRQLDVANQRGRELQAQTDLNKAIVELERVSGGILTSNNIDASALGGTSLNGAQPGVSNLPPAPAATAPPVRRTP